MGSICHRRTVPASRELQIFTEHIRLIHLFHVWRGFALNDFQGRDERLQNNVSDDSSWKWRHPSSLTLDCSFVLCCFHLFVAAADCPSVSPHLSVGSLLAFLQHIHIHDGSRSLHVQTRVRALCLCMCAAFNWAVVMGDLPHGVPGGEGSHCSEHYALSIIPPSHCTCTGLLWRGRKTLFFGRQNLLWPSTNLTRHRQINFERQEMAKILWVFFYLKSHSDHLMTYFKTIPSVCLIMK